MHSEKAKHLSKPLIFALIVVLVFTMAPLWPNMDSEVAAAGGATEITIINGKTTLKNFDAADLDSLPQYSYAYSSINNFGTYSIVLGSGASVESILSSAGLDIDKISASTELVIVAGDGSENNLTWKALTEPRFFFTNPEGIKVTEVPSIINSPKAESDPKRFLMGQTNKDEKNKPRFTNNVEKIIVSPAAVLKVDKQVVSDKIKIKLYANKGKFAGSKKIKNISKDRNKKLGKVTVPKRKGYKFTGWYTKKSKGKKYTAKTKVSKNITLYAHWARKATVNFKNKNLNLRSKASLSGKVLGRYAHGTKIIILGSNGSWYKVKVGKITGFMSKNYVKLSKK